MARNRVARLNSLLKEVISEVIREDVDNPHVNQFVSVTQVEITSDLHHAKVHISVIGDQKVKEETIKAPAICCRLHCSQFFQKWLCATFPILALS